MLSTKQGSSKHLRQHLHGDPEQLPDEIKSSGKRKMLIQLSRQNNQENLQYRYCKRTSTTGSFIAEIKER